VHDRLLAKHVDGPAVEAIAEIASASTRIDRCRMYGPSGGERLELIELGSRERRARPVAHRDQHRVDVTVETGDRLDEEALAPGAARVVDLGAIQRVVGGAGHDDSNDGAHGESCEAGDTVDSRASASAACASSARSGRPPDQIKRSPRCSTGSARSAPTSSTTAAIAARAAPAGSAAAPIVLASRADDRGERGSGSRGGSGGSFARLIHQLGHSLGIHAANEPVEHRDLGVVDLGRIAAGAGEQKRHRHPGVGRRCGWRA